MKKVIVRNSEGKKKYEFLVTDAELKVAEKLGISMKDYIMEKTKINLAERKTKDE